MYRPDCRETIEVLEGDHLLDRICGDRIESRISGATFTFTSKQHELLIRYSTQEKRVSHYKLPFIYYEFKNATDELEDIVGEYRSYVYILRIQERYRRIRRYCG